MATRWLQLNFADSVDTILGLGNASANFTSRTANREPRRAKFTGSSEESDKAPRQDAADRIGIRLRFDTDSSLGQQLGAADLGCSLVESPQRLLASLRSQGDVEAVREVGRSLAEQLQRDFERALGFEGQLGRR